MAQALLHQSGRYCGPGPTPSVRGGIISSGPVLPHQSGVALSPVDQAPLHQSGVVLSPVDQSFHHQSGWYCEPGLPPSVRGGTVDQALHHQSGVVLSPVDQALLHQSGVALSPVDQALLHQSLIEKMPTDTPTGQSDGGNSSSEAPSSHMTMCLGDKN